MGVSGGTMSGMAADTQDIAGQAQAGQHRPQDGHDDDAAMVLVVRGEPKPQPRPRFVGKGRVVSTADAVTRTWAERIRVEARQAIVQRYGLSWSGHVGAVQVDMTFVLPIRDKKRWGEFCTNKPDTDNLSKLVMDALERAGLFAVGDQQVVAGTVVKVLGAPEDAGVCVVVSRPKVDTVSGALAMYARQNVVDRPDWLG